MSWSDKRRALLIAVALCVVAAGIALTFKLRSISDEFDRLKLSADFNALAWNNCIAAEVYDQLKKQAGSADELFAACKDIEDDFLEAAAHMQNPQATSGDVEKLRASLRAVKLEEVMQQLEKSQKPKPSAAPPQP